MFCRDRAGGREGKKQSLRKNKKQIAEALKIAQSTPRTDLPDFSPPPFPLNDPSDPMSIIDVGCNLVNRQFDRDLQKVLTRAASSAVDAMIISTADFDKIETAIQLCKTMSGSVYCTAGIHPDSIKRTNEKLFHERQQQLREFLLSEEVVALACGLDFSRDISTHFAQEKILISQIKLAGELKIPLLITEISAGERMAEILAEHRAEFGAACMCSFTSSEDTLNAYLALDLFIGLTGAVCHPTTGPTLSTTIRSLPLDRLVIGSDSPFQTPQNIPDAYLRETRNEPSNLPFVLEAVAAALGKGKEEVAKATRENTKRLFGFKDATEAQKEREELEAAMAALAEQEGEEGSEGSEGSDQEVAECPEKENHQPAAATAAAVVVTEKITVKSGGKPAIAAEPKQQHHEEPKKTEKGGKGKKGGKKFEESPSEDESHHQQQQAAGKKGKGASKVLSDSEEDQAVNNTKKSGKKDGKKKKGGKHSDQETPAEPQQQQHGKKEKKKGRKGKRGGDMSESEPSESEQQQSKQKQKEEEEQKRREKRMQKKHQDKQAEVVAVVSQSTVPAEAVPVAESTTAPAAPDHSEDVSAYACKKCRLALFLSSDLEHHEIGRKSFAGKKGGDEDREAVCSMHFLQPLEWMDSENGEMEGKIECPECETKLGRWSLAGMQCSCGTWISPAYQIVKSRVEVLFTDDVETLAARLAEMQGGSDEESDDGEDPNRPKKEKKRKVVSIRRSNLSSFRNKDFNIKKLTSKEKIAEKEKEKERIKAAALLPPAEESQESD